MPAHISAQCPKCKLSQTYIIDSRLTSRGRRRRYYCNACEHRFSTLEVPWENYVDLTEAIDKMRSLSRVESVKSFFKFIMRDE